MFCCTYGMVGSLVGIEIWLDGVGFIWNFDWTCQGCAVLCCAVLNTWQVCKMCWVGDLVGLEIWLVGLHNRLVWKFG